ncbi:hypothetical protein [Streptomyces sp. NPDC051909]
MKHRILRHLAATLTAGLICIPLVAAAWGSTPSTTLAVSAVSPR